LDKMCLTRCGEQTAAMIVNNLRRSESVDHTRRSRC